MKQHRVRIPSFLFADSILDGPVRTADHGGARRLVILLHGYEQSGQKIFEHLKSVLPANAAVLAPNAPFPIPRKTEKGYRMGFSWYFYDPRSDEYYVDMEIAVDFVKKLVKAHQLENLPTTLIGFSQGGYLAPFLAQAMPSVDHIISLGAEYLVEEMKFPIRYQADSVHGALDEVVSSKSAARAHEKLLAQSLLELPWAGRFQLLGDTGHRIDQAMLNAVASLLASFSPAPPPRSFSP